MKKNIRVFLLVLVCAISAYVTVNAGGSKPLLVGDAAYYKLSGGKLSLVSAPTTGDIVTKVRVYNYGDEEGIQATLITAVYDKTSNKLQDVALDSLTVTHLTEDLELSAQVNIPDINAYSFRYFVWDGISSMMPLGNTEPTAPENVTVTSFTNSTANVLWSHSEDDITVSYYEVYRNGKLVGETSDNSFKDVGITHNTDIAYNIIAVDQVGAKSAQSAGSQTVTTKDIARLWLGGLAGQTITSNTTLAGHNLSVSGTTHGTSDSSGDYTYTHSVTSKGYADTLTTTAGKTYRLGLDSVIMGKAKTKIFMSIDEQFAAKMNAEENVKFIVTYLDNFTQTRTNGPLWLRYTEKTGSTSDLGGLVSITPTTANRWNTEIYTVPTASVLSGNAVFARGLQFNNISTSSTQNKPAAVSLVSNLNPTLDGFEGYFAKIDIAGNDYVPYGAVLNFDNPVETQFINFFQRDGYNLANIEQYQGRKAIKLYSTENESSPEGTINTSRYLSIRFDEHYLTSSDRKVILRLTYYDDFEDDKNNLCINYRYMQDSGTAAAKTLNVSKRTNSGEWKTEEFVIDDACFDNGLNSNLFSMKIFSRTLEENAIYISNVEVIKR